MRTQMLLPATIDTSAFGKNMQALTEMQQRFVLAYVIGGGQNMTAAVVEAGYSAATAQQQGYNLLRNTRIQEAIHEEAIHRLQGGALLGISVIIEIAQDPLHKDRLKAAKLLAEGTKVITPPDQVIKVEHTVSEKEQVKAITAMALKLGIDPKELLGQYGVVTDAEFEDVTSSQARLPAPEHQEADDLWTIVPEAEVVPA